jgi:hypothetical protein
LVRVRLPETPGKVREMKMSGKSTVLVLALAVTTTLLKPAILSGQISTPAAGAIWQRQQIT